MKIIWFIVLACCLFSGCSYILIVEPYDIFLAPKDRLTLECSEVIHGMDCYRPWPDYDFETYAQVLYGRNCNIDRDSSLLTIDIKVYPKNVQKKIIFYPALIITTAGSDTLEVVKSKKECSGRFDRCCYRISFKLTPASMSTSEIFNDTTLFTIDLSRALSYDGAPFDMGIIKGKLTK